MSAGDQECHRLTSPFVADIKVAEAAQVPDGDLAVAVELVPTNSVLNRWS
jgi:hypothetical protein